MKKNEPVEEKFKTMIGGQALIEGIMMRGPEKDAVVVRGKDGIQVEVTPRRLPKSGPLRWPLIRGVYTFLDSQITGVKALMHSADLAPEEYAGEENPSKLDLWLEKKLGNERFRQGLVSFAVVLGVVLSVALFFVLPMLLGGIFDRWVESNLAINLIEGAIRMTIFLVYMISISRMEDMRRLFAYHGAEHKTIRCYEAGLPLTVENVRKMTRLHPRCGTSFLLVVLLLSILVFSAASSGLLAAIPGLQAMQGTLVFRLLMILFKLLLIPLVVSISYEINRWAGRHNNWFTRFLTAPGMWFQKFTTGEPDDEMIAVGIAAVQAVLPEKEGSDAW